ncbi:thiol-disulfide oxidoreductase DCC family protein [Chengkuizengella axinellae]|uniref:Thiol-disulfide oxidoreductase DCC family protein n=1 Tax=Chengkuizengella axinellae TaxID=3064388 RepID=A0ABT9J2G3_9BACL|nr:thiol-disulfide oxidoreductase DCC family protein [Chengkuizengella sp. 2205SS18-9]MDP5275763.1 thiol-disulfide oxidoreductase DCC family protein [Chengkuizengella sp. 2205SS18-9]
MNKSSILLFDGECNLCNSTVQFILPRDSKGDIKFASLQSETGQKLLEKYNLNADQMDTVVLIENGRAFTKSTAALRICLHLKKCWPILFGITIIPKLLRDVVYDWIAKNRYKWFGKKDQCMIPKKEFKNRFLN